jgi:hypothetical protein
MSHTFEHILQDIQSCIESQPNDPTLVYIGVGTYAGLLTDIDNGIKILEEKNYHQYPPFIKMLKKTVPNLHLYIVLIDPIQENPPYMINDSKYTEEQFYEESSDIFSSYDGFIKIHVLREPVTISEIYDSTNCVDIQHQLRQLNQFCIEKHVSLLYHDYSGRCLKTIAEYFDESLGENINTIIYGFGARANFGCYFDLTSPVSYYPYEIQQRIERKQLIFFNIFKYINSREFYKINEFTDSNNESVLLQINEFKNSIIYKMKNIIIYSLRTIRHFQDGEHFDMNQYIFSQIEKEKREHMIQLFENKKYNMLFDELIKYYSREVDIYARLKQLDLSGEEILRFIIADPNPYNWTDQLRHFI